MPITRCFRSRAIRRVWCLVQDGSNGLEHTRSTQPIARRWSKCITYSRKRSSSIGCVYGSSSLQRLDLGGSLHGSSPQPTGAASWARDASFSSLGSRKRAKTNRPPTTAPRTVVTMPSKPAGHPERHPKLRLAPLHLVVGDGLLDAVEPVSDLRADRVESCAHRGERLVDVLVVHLESGGSFGLGGHDPSPCRGCLRWRARHPSRIPGSGRDAKQNVVYFFN